MVARRKLLLFLLMALPAPAQVFRTPLDGQVTTVEGEVRLGGELLKPAPQPLLVSLKNSELRAGHGRAEVLLAPGTTLHVEEQSIARLAGRRVELPYGSFRLDREAVSATRLLTFAFLESLVTIWQPGEYYFDTHGRRLIVIEGTASVSLGADHFQVAAGHSLSLHIQPAVERLKRTRMIF